MTPTSAGHIWVEGDFIKWLSEYTGGLRQFKGDMVAFAGTSFSGHKWVNFNYLYYIDESGYIREIEGVLGSEIGKEKGHIWVEGKSLWYIDYLGRDRELPEEPEKMFTLNSIQPEKIYGTGINAWIKHSVAGMVPPDATGIVGIAVNADTGVERHFGVRPVGGTNFPFGAIKRRGMTGFICGIDSNQEFEMFCGYPTVIYLWVMGYTGKNVHFLNNALDFHPAASMAWTEIDTSLNAPNALACLWSCGTKTLTAGGWKMRVKGSTDDWWNNGFHTYPVLGVDADGKVEVMVSAYGLTRSSTHLIGYIDSYFEKHTNAKDVTPGASGAWLSVAVDDIVPNTPWVSLQEWEGSGAYLYGMRKGGGYFDEKRETGGGEWMLVHANSDGECDLWLPLAGRKFYLHGEFQPDVV